MLGLLLAVVLGPPAPGFQDQSRSAWEQQIEKRLAEAEKTADGLFLDSAVIATGSAFDVWATDHCISKGRCYELNPLGQVPTQRLALKAAVYPVKVGICYLLRRWGHHNWARGAAIGFGAVDTALGFKALSTTR